jgi:hypothetical protein
MRSDFCGEMLRVLELIEHRIEQGAARATGDDRVQTFDTCVDVAERRDLVGQARLAVERSEPLGQSLGRPSAIAVDRDVHALADGERGRIATGVGQVRAQLFHLVHEGRRREPTP